MTNGLVERFEKKMQEMGYPTYMSVDNIYMDVRTRNLFTGYQIGYIEATLQMAEEIKRQQIEMAYAEREQSTEHYVNELENVKEEL